MSEIPSAPRTGGRLLLRSLRRERRPVALLVLLLGVWQLGEALVPVLIGVVVDLAVSTSDAGQLLWWMGALAVVFVVFSWSYRGGARTGVTAMQREVHALRTEVAAAVLHPRGVRTRLLPGETLTLAGSDAEAVGAIILQVGHGAGALVALIGSAVLLLGADVWVGLVVLGGVPGVLLCAHLLTPVIEARTAVQQATIARAGGLATDLLRGLRPLRGIGAEEAAVERYRAASREAQAAGVRAAWSMGTLVGVSSGLSGLLLAVVALLSGQLALDGRIGIGALIAIVGLAQFLAGPLEALSHLTALAAASRASGQRIADFLAEPRLVAAGATALGAPPSGRPVLVVESVHAPGLDGLTLQIQPGELLGVVVPDPAVAATLVRLLRGELGGAVSAGEVLVHGVPLTETDMSTRRQWLTVTDDRVELFEGTLREAVDPGGRCSETELHEVLHASAATDVVLLDPAGVDRRLTSGAGTLSGGQRQRIALARALASDAPVLVLHEPTSAVDAVTEQRIAEGLRAVRHDGPVARSTVVLTSSPALLDAADRVVLLSEGRVRADGTHRELLADPGYRTAVLR